ncbi:olfactory receptor 10Q1-like [Hippopotamus amphibius kiboko]|uniref:olfactory receptor 10Q1-like n=1 Tax=Hippopotamus amphibius kiboko TaxID=575201 RepID=UPI002596F491|nr:olfactory receptor 10Q1-like [Hippopotamus amphibius kiboko]
MAPLCENSTLSSEFIILGFGDLAELQICFFGLFLVLHLVTLAGHTATVFITLLDPCLQTPMYFFLRHLSAIEICYVLVIVPNMLASFLSGSQRMPFLGCALQMHLFIALGGAECFLLAVMAYDRFVAICKPLHYTAIITRTLCLQMLALVCVSGFALSLTLTTLIFLLPFCQSHEINHFFCDIPAVLFLACSDTRANEIAVFLVCLLILLIPFLLILLSYGFIITAILSIHSAEGRSKAFSTCAGHLLVSLLHYGCAIFIYIRPKSCYAPEQDKIVSLIYTNVTPMLYPMIYSLRNKEVKGALKRLLESHDQMRWGSSGVSVIVSPSLHNDNTQRVQRTRRDDLHKALKQLLHRAHSRCSVSTNWTLIRHELWHRNSFNIPLSVCDAGTQFRQESVC